MEKICEVVNPKLSPVYVKKGGDTIIVPPKGRARYKLSAEEIKRFKESGLIVK